ncbi:hypothetical protein COLO4_15989 [Corchorus olitorius]|uniref:Uncharacterized protein n=1 Tax=Corchorus olitorius TaxID=93759 RepID=A0A1R3JKB6_9ROSI|nr:hypothetical protein COLO4_15989 [Corchorus olitorius]
MTASIEALAMAGVDYNEWGLSIKKWEADDQSNWAPPHLLAEEEPQRVSKHDFEIMNGGNCGDDANVGAFNLGCIICRTK